MKGRYLAAALLGALLGVAGVGVQYAVTPEPAMQSFVGTVVYAGPMESVGFLGHTRSGLLLRLAEYKGAFEYPWYGESRGALAPRLARGARIAVRTGPDGRGPDPLREILAIDAIDGAKEVVAPERNIATKRALSVAEGGVAYAAVVGLGLALLAGLFAWLGGRAEEGGGALWAGGAWFLGGVVGALLVVVVALPAWI